MKRRYTKNLGENLADALSKCAKAQDRMIKAFKQFDRWDREVKRLDRRIAAQQKKLD